MCYCSGSACEAGRHLGGRAMTLAALPPARQSGAHPEDRGGLQGAQALHLLGALARFVVARRPDVVHIHFASRASSVRKMSLARFALARGCKVSCTRPAAPTARTGSRSDRALGAATWRCCAACTP